MSINMKDMKIKTKFAIFGGMVFFMFFVSLIGMMEIAKTTYFQRLERNHAEGVVYFEWKSFEFFKKLKDDSSMLDADMTKWVTKEAGTHKEMGLIQLVNELKDQPTHAFEAINPIEKMLFRLLGLGEIINLCNDDITSCNHILDALNKYKDAKMSETQLMKVLKTETDLIKDYGANFSILVNKSASIIKNLMIFIVVVSFVSTLIFLILFAKMVIRPIIKITDISLEIAKGDLRKRINLRTKDELGNLSESFDTMVEKTREIIDIVLSKSEVLNDSSESLAVLSGEMLENSKNSSSMAGTIALAAEEMSANMNSVSTTTEHASNNVGMIAAAMEEMSTTIEDIAQNTEKARSITSKAVEQAKNASDKVDELGNAANEISKVTETITEISEQTNLLALNATIEAARAGESGKGFAVVANEIKDLAKQTADATQKIKMQIEGIQSKTDDTVNEIGQISKVISEINQIVVTITTAIEEQSIAGKDIAENVAQASIEIQEITKNVVQSSTVSNKITGDISKVNQMADEISGSNSRLNTKARELTSIAGELKEKVRIFIV
ncbi:methyl-accepting chemotaxis protein [Desulfosarcina ovata]|uniref:Methyl-accepting chemotaxis protein n=1 Tax=Desulfosarcina ovata subsp. ovata TaxID=2752305 RepID=A0A5K8A398_9BACT|nr:methyl-accepting chemotaxis protein [Desulfosarcina ovata]BBO86868.1 hypothetical protein DSCOOX_00480 [Desulfosarcina ovata subsp. ovata]